VSLPPRPLWPDPPPPTSINSWRSLGDDLLAGLRQHNLQGVIGVGHSFGTIATMLAAISDPARFRALVLLDPTVFMPERLAMVEAARAAGQESRLPLVEGARRRRSQFGSLDEAFAYWREKPLFADWSDDALQAYVESAVRPVTPSPSVSNGDALELAWSPEWEARYYETLFTESWEELPKLRGQMPILSVRGATTNVTTADVEARMRDVLLEMDTVTIDGYGHLFPQAAPDATRVVIEAWLRKHNLQ
jgi:pimeloyl-ACP methyl ester carboxylesterase